MTKLITQNARKLSNILLEKQWFANIDNNLETAVGAQIILSIYLSSTGQMEW